MLEIIVWAVVPVFCLAAAWFMLGRMDDGIEEPLSSSPANE